MKEYKFQFTVTCSNSVEPDMNKVEAMIDLAMQDLVYDDEFIAALDEKEAVTIQVAKLAI